MELITNNKGGQKLCYKGYMYNKQRESDTACYWRCSEAYGGCKGRIKSTLNMQSLDLLSDHNHDPDQKNVEVTKARSQMKRLASTTDEKPSKIICRVTGAMPEDAQGFLPHADTCKRTIRNQRSRKFPPEPHDAADLVIEGEWALTLAGNDHTPQEFLLFDNRDATNRIICFCSPAQLTTLAVADKWFIDGNFAMSPKNFLQVYFIRVPVGDVNVVTAIALFRRKNFETYREFFEKLVRKCENTFGHIPCPRICMIDFELAASNALQSVFGQGISVKGCFYHLTQSTWRKVQQLGLVNQYKEQEEFRHFCGMLDGLAFLPVQDLSEGMAYIRSVAPSEAQDLVEYFDATYVSGPLRIVQAPDGQCHQRRTTPVFEHQLWNVHEVTLYGDPRTNNICEAWNNKLSHLIGHAHPSVWRLIKGFQYEEQSVRVALAQTAIGNNPKKKVSRKTQEYQRRLQQLCKDYQERRKNLQQFLGAVGHCIRIRSTTAD